LIVGVGAYTWTDLWEPMDPPQLVFSDNLDRTYDTSRENESRPPLFPPTWGGPKGEADEVEEANKLACTSVN